MKENYQLALDKVLSSLTGAAPHLMLHSCCGPCRSYVLSYLARYFRITLLYYNPNIHPEAEYQKRLETQRRLLAQLPTAHPVTLAEDRYDPAEFFEAVKGFEAWPEGGPRCGRCFELRLERTAAAARAAGADWFCTTLTVSPHKDAQLLNALGEEIGARYGVRWLPSDFKKRDGYRQSVALSKRYGLYRQDYCGCVFAQTAEKMPPDAEKHS